ncbi:HYD1 signature containing ADP-ribosyltransferase family protein [Nocardia sp. XZ_19_369]|uniref:HYD1 signature containing ADP-ribosyltransferase family protein n=1 Tax=Nocardia sp. XZ_19_369 TaxID=2769487 RepID=UPI00189099CC
MVFRCWRWGLPRVRLTQPNQGQSPDIEPGTRTPAQLSAAFLRVPWAGAKFSHFLEIDVTGLTVVQGRPGVFVVPNTEPLDLTGRIVRSGRN